MTDYYPVILRAVAALETNTFEARRAIYNRVRAVQSYQLGQRPFNKADFDRERSTLEDAISRVEIEATNKHRATENSWCGRRTIGYRRHIGYATSASP